MKASPSKFMSSLLGHSRGPRVYPDWNVVANGKMTVLDLLEGEPPATHFQSVSDFVERSPSGIRVSVHFLRLRPRDLGSLWCFALDRFRRSCRNPHPQLVEANPSRRQNQSEKRDLQARETRNE